MSPDEQTPSIGSGGPTPGPSGNAIASLVLGILSFLACPFILAIGAVFFGRRAKKEIRNSSGQQTGTGLAKAGTILGVLNIALTIVVAIAIAVLAIVADDPADELSLDPQSNATEPTGTTPESLEGTWAIQAEGDSQAGFRIDEEFLGGISHTAVGRSPEVTGEITIAGTEVTAASFTVDLTALEFTDDPPTGSVGNRAGAMTDRGLETDRFPEASFTLTEPIALGEIPADDETTTVEATGDLTLHGVTRSITFSVDALIAGDTIRVATTDPVPIVLADYDIERPTAPFVASVADEGSFEFLMVFQQA